MLDGSGKAPGSLIFLVRRAVELCLLRASGAVRNTNAMKVTHAAISMLQNNILNSGGEEFMRGGRSLRALRLLQTQFHHNVLKKMYKSQSARSGCGRNEIRIYSLTQKSGDRSLASFL
jgi:hypothetical protein